MSEHDRLAIYKIFGKTITATLPSSHGGKTIAGAVDKVYRNPLDRTIELTIAGGRYTFKEPHTITFKDDTLTLAYGGLCRTTDKDLFDEMRNANLEESIYEVMRRTDDAPLSVIQFKVDGVTIKRKTRLSLEINPLPTLLQQLANEFNGICVERESAVGKKYAICQDDMTLATIEVGVTGKVRLRSFKHQDYILIEKLHATDIDDLVAQLV